jgi:4-alpha-glucanotransferase
MSQLQLLLRFRSQPGQLLFISGDHASLGSNDLDQAVALNYLNEDFWQLTVELGGEKAFNYQYILKSGGNLPVIEWGSRLFDPSLGANQVCVDTWNEPAHVGNAFNTQPFTKVFFPSKPSAVAKNKQKTNHNFEVEASLLQPGEQIVLVGNIAPLGSWKAENAVKMRFNGEKWLASVDLSAESMPIAYKYAIVDATGNLVAFEDGNNRLLYEIGSAKHSIVNLRDGFVRLTNRSFKGAGVAIPIFSLRSEAGFGVGEFADLPALADWAAEVGMRMIQLLPINDTSATFTWADSYPYAPISTFALHPIYLRLSDVAGKEHAALLKPFAKKQHEVNLVETVDYDAVIAAKWEMIRILYPKLKADWLKDGDYTAYFESQKHWLRSYAVFCFLRDKHKTADFSQWPTEHQSCTESLIESLFDKKNKDLDEVLIHCFVQYQLHVQLTAGVAYVHSKGLAIKGDIPVGIFRNSCDAWESPELFHMNWQAGAPPDDFAVNGQNWGFPTYNWGRMQQDGYLWWRNRFEQMGLYFDAFRIDHILGFFRIWSIPMHAVQGLLGRFIPAIPVRVEELYARGIGFDYDRYCKPYITPAILSEMFGVAVGNEIVKQFLDLSSNDRFSFKPEFDTQRKLEIWFAANQPENETLRDQLYTLHANVMMIADENDAYGYHFRINMEKTASYQAMSGHERQVLRDLYLNYFYRRQDNFWKREALTKLPALKRSTNMLICGEDLGMMPDCVPEVMAGLGMLSLEIQRMPKQSGTRFFHPGDAPYLSVVTPDTHDMSTLRGWWEEDRNLTQIFFNEMLGEYGQMPYFCEAWVNRKLIRQHLHSPAMWTIFQLQDLLGSDAALRRDNPNEERINLPSNPKHYWRYRMHLTLDTLAMQSGFNADLKGLIGESGR